MNLGWAAATAAVSFAVAQATPTQGAQLVVLAVALVVLGLPHGALDDRVSARIFRVRGILFYVAYLAPVVATGLAWWVAPQASFLAFLAASAWHFGEGDLRELGPGPGATAARLTRGALIVGVLFTAQPAQVAELLGPSLSAEAPPAHASVTIALSLLAVHAAALIAARGDRLSTTRAVVDAAAVTLWLSLAPPLLAFAGYFACWHSRAHVETLYREGFGRAFWVRSLRLTVAAAVGGAVVLACVHRFAPQVAIAEALLPVIAALAAPHMALVEAWRRRARSGLWAHGGPRLRKEGAASNHAPPGAVARR
ncbi:MAG: Brp/Blh family beta-carotene 15,15'-dioxygenase [Myxococcota bacterium]|nr:Brp/Blh family beta-carotene 15,15'-dioxygenase [Myxococcota bacterium]